MTILHAQDAIARYLEGVLGTPVSLVGRAPGASHEGWIFRHDRDPGAQVIVRIEPTIGPFLTYDGAAEAALLRALGARHLPVPRVLAEGRQEFGGSGFLVLDWIDGVVLNPQAAGLAPLDERRRLAVELATTLARLHRVPWRDLCGDGGPFAAEPDGALAAYLREFDVTLTQLTVVNSLVLDFVRVWLQLHAPGHDGDLALVHGDFRLGNLVWRDGRVVGILDWETARIGNPLFDLAWLCMGAIDGGDIIMGLVPRDEFVALYERACGRVVPPRALAYWQVVAAWVRGCTEARLLNIALTAHRPAERDARDLSWEFGSHRTDEELLALIAVYEKAVDEKAVYEKVV